MSLKISIQIASKFDLLNIIKNWIINLIWKLKKHIKIDLKTKKVSGNKDHMARGSYSIRSQIPELLIKSLIDQSIKHLKK